jgi:hypothetical protein
MTVSPTKARARDGLSGALPKTPFFNSILPELNLANTTSLSQAQIT